MRTRCARGYTIIDLARAVGVMPNAAEEIVDEYLV